MYKINCFDSILRKIRSTCISAQTRTNSQKYITIFHYIYIYIYILHNTVNTFIGHYLYAIKYTSWKHYVMNIY